MFDFASGLNIGRKGRQALSAFFLLFGGLMVALPGAADTGDDLITAARLDNQSAVESLLKRGVSPNVTEPARGETPLMMAAREGAMKTFAVLLNARGVNVNARAKNGDSALMIAAFKKNRQAVEMLLAWGAVINHDGWTALHYAAAAGDTEIVQILLKKSAEVDARSPNLTTPLMMAVTSGNIYTVKALLEAGADLNMANELGLTAIDFAKRGKHTEIVEGLQFRQKRNERLAAEAVEAEEKRERPLGIDQLLPPMD